MRIPYNPTSSSEQFREIPNYPGYCAGNYGTILSCRRRGRNVGFHNTWTILPSRLNGKGYLVVTICGKVVSVHTLVMLAWVGPRPEFYEVCHFPDTTKTNNHLNNLRYGTKSDNHTCFNGKTQNIGVHSYSGIIL